MTDDLRSKIDWAFEDVRPPDADREAIHSRARRIRIRHMLERGGVAAILVLGVVTPLIMLRGLGSEDQGRPRDSEPGVALSSEGVSMEIPLDWNGDSVPVDGFPRPPMVAATVPISGELDDQATSLRQELRSSRDALVWLVEYTAICPPCEDFVPVESANELTLSLNDLSGYPDRRYPLAVESIDGHAAASQLFVVGGRYFDLRVEFGALIPDETRLAETNAIISSIEIGEPSSLDGSCSNTFLDSDCPEHVWLVDVLQGAGFSMQGDTGSALLAKKDGLVVTAWVAMEKLPTGQPAQIVSGIPVHELGHDTMYWEAYGDRQVVIRVKTNPVDLDGRTLEQLVTGSQEGGSGIG